MRLIKRLTIAVAVLVLSVSTSLLAATSKFEPLPEALKTNRSIAGIASSLTAKSWILVEPKTGWVLASHNSDMRIEPASLTKLMTIYLAFKRIQSGEMALHDKISISKKAWRMEGSRMFVEVGDSISVIKMLKRKSFCFYDE